MLAVDEDDHALARIERELERRYGVDYQVVVCSSSASARQCLGELKARQVEVAIVLADHALSGLTGAELLTEVNGLYPIAKRALLINWGAWADPAATEALLRAIALGQADYYVLKPWRSPDEYFHRTIAEFVHEWSRLEPSAPKEVAVVGEQWSARSNEVVSLLARSGFPHTFFAVSSPEGRRLLDDSGYGSARLPVVFALNATPLVDPTTAEVAAAVGVSTRLERRRFDVVVVGAGPAGLAAAVYASSEGLDTLVVEREAIGGQASSSSLIRNYLGFSRGVSGSELATRAYQQAWVFGTTFLVTQSVTALAREDGVFRVGVSDGADVHAKVVVLAMGVAYRRLGIPELEALAGAGVFYGASVTEARALAGQHAYLVGGGNSAGQATMHLARFAARVTLLVRGDSLAESMSQYLIDEIEARSNVEVRLNAEVVGGGGDGRLEHLDVRDRTSGQAERVEAAALFLFIGARPHTDWLPPELERDDRGFVVAGSDVSLERTTGTRSPLHLETSMPGVFAVGDVRHRSVKRVASAVGEGSISIQQVHEYLAGQHLGGAPAAAEARIAPSATQPPPDVRDPRSVRS